MGFSVFLFGFGEEIAVDFDSQSPISKLPHHQGVNHASAALLIEGITQGEEVPSSNAKLYVDYTYVDADTGEIIETIILL